MTAITGYRLYGPFRRLCEHRLLFFPCGPVLRRIHRDPKSRTEKVVHAILPDQDRIVYRRLACWRDLDRIGPLCEQDGLQGQQTDKKNNLFQSLTFTTVNEYGPASVVSFPFFTAISRLEGLTTGEWPMILIAAASSLRKTVRVPFPVSFPAPSIFRGIDCAFPETFTIFTISSPVASSITADA